MLSAIAARPYDTHSALCDTTRIVVQCTGGGVRHDAEDPRVHWSVDITHIIKKKSKKRKKPPKGLDPPDFDDFESRFLKF